MEKFEDFDNDLQSMVNYSDKTVPAAMPVMEQKARPKAAQQSEPAKDEAMEAAYPCILVSAMVGTAGAVWNAK